MVMDHMTATGHHLGCRRREVLRLYRGVRNVDGRIRRALVPRVCLRATRALRNKGSDFGSVLIQGLGVCRVQRGPNRGNIVRVFNVEAVNLHAVQCFDADVHYDPGWRCERAHQHARSDSVFWVDGPVY